jgi:repressor LexA
MDRTETIYNFIEQYIKTNVIPPTVREIQDGCAISSTSVVSYNLNKLEQARRIRRVPETARGIILINGKETHSENV